MNKIRIKSTRLFKQVATVIGEERAQIKLAIAYHGYSSHTCNFNFGEYLLRAFCWFSTPQRFEFWEAIDEGINPCNN